jgi:hypothetical protein
VASAIFVGWELYTGGRDAGGVPHIGGMREVGLWCGGEVGYSGDRTTKA